MLTGLLLALSTNLTAPLPSAAAAGGTVEHPDLAGLTERWAEAAEQFGVPGFAVVVVQDGEVVLNTTWGQRDVERELPVTQDTMFYIASATKPFVALALLKLEAEGKVDLDRPIKSYLPRFELDTSDAQGRLKINPLIDWSAEDIAAYFEKHDLPRHPLIERGFPSIGCSPCTRPVADGEDARSGRWAGWDKVECGIHKPGEEPFL